MREYFLDRLTEGRMYEDFLDKMMDRVGGALFYLSALGALALMFLVMVWGIVAVVREIVLMVVA